MTETTRFRDRVAISIDGAIAEVRLSRPNKHNAIDPATLEALIEAGNWVKDNKSVRCVILTGEGPSFCAGIDMSAFAAIADGGQGGAASANTLAERTHGIVNRPQKAVWIWRELPVPVIAAIHGVAFGGGFQLALSACFRIASPLAKLGLLEVKWGLVPDMCGPTLLRNLLSETLIKELVYTGKTITGERAKRLGLVTEVSETPLEAARTMALELVKHSPSALAEAKVLINQSIHMSDAESLLLESKAEDRLVGKPDQVEAVKARLEGRDPAF